MKSNNSEPAQPSAENKLTYHSWKIPEDEKMLLRYLDNSKVLPYVTGYFPEPREGFAAQWKMEVNVPAIGRITFYFSVRQDEHERHFPHIEAWIHGTPCHPLTAHTLACKLIRRSGISETGKSSLQQAIEKTGVVLT